jgi:endonuclease-3
MMKISEINAIFEVWEQANPNPKTELNYDSPYELLVAVVLSAQSTDRQVNIVTEQLFSMANSPSKMLELGEKKLTQIIQSIGLYRSKAANIIKLSQLLVEKYCEVFPSTLEALISLPGVGVKTANVVLNVLYGLPTIAVDTHVFRVSNRLGFVHAKTVEQAQKQLPMVVPDNYKKYAHHWMILHGRYVCQAKKPLCSSCGIWRYCQWEKKHAP